MRRSGFGYQHRAAILVPLNVGAECLEYRVQGNKGAVIYNFRVLLIGVEGNALAVVQHSYEAVDGAVRKVS